MHEKFVNMSPVCLKIMALIVIYQFKIREKYTRNLLPAIIWWLFINRHIMHFIPHSICASLIVNYLECQIIILAFWVPPSLVVYQYAHNAFYSTYYLR